MGSAHRMKTVSAVVLPPDHCCLDSRSHLAENLLHLSKKVSKGVIEQQHKKKKRVMMNSLGEEAPTKSQSSQLLLLKKISMIVVMMSR